MTSFLKTTKLTVIKMDVIMTDIRRIWMSVDSDYTIAKRKLLEAKSILYSDIKKAYKLIYKAHRDVVEESKAAQEYNLYRDAIAQVDDKEVRILDQRYRDQILNGDYRKARETAIRISQCEIIKGIGHSMNVVLESVTDDHLGYNVINISSRNLVVKRFAVYIDGTQLVSDVVYPFSMHHNSTIHVRFDREGVKGSKASVIFEYTEDDIVKMITFDTPINKEG